VSLLRQVSNQETAWRDGATHLVMSRLEFMQRLAALVPRPRLHLIRFGVRITSLREVSGPPLRAHGVLAPNAKLRALVVPQDAGSPAQAAPAAAAPCAHHRPVRLSWAKLLKRVFEIDMEHCPNCGGHLRIIAAIMEQPVIEKILTHLGPQADGGRMTEPARGHAPQEGLALASASAARRAGHRRARQPVGRNCKRPETRQPTRFMRPGAQGRGDRLRHSFSELWLGARSPGKTRRRSPRMKLVWAATDPQQGAAESKDRTRSPRMKLVWAGINPQ